MLGPTYIASTIDEPATQVAGYFNALPEQTAISIALHVYNCLVNLSYFHCHYAFRKASSYTPDKQTCAFYYSGTLFFLINAMTCL